MSLDSRREEVPLPPSEDFVVAQTADDDDTDLVVAPPEGLSPGEVAEKFDTHPDRPVRSLSAEPAVPPRSALSFSLFELLAAMTFISVALAGATWLKLELFVGLTGLFTVLCLLVFFVFPLPNSRVTRLAWSTLVATYVLSAAVALVRTFF